MNGYFIDLNKVNNQCIKEIEGYLKVVRSVADREEEFKRRISMVEKVGKGSDNQGEGADFEYEQEYDPSYKLLQNSRKKTRM